MKSFLEKNTLFSSHPGITYHSCLIDEIYLYIANLMLSGVNIRVYCIDDVVILEGTVLNQSQAEVLIQMIKRVKHVRAVRAKIIIQPPLPHEKK